MEAETPAPIMKSVSIIAMGSSFPHYCLAFEAAGSKRPTDEAWAVNSAMYWLSPTLLTHGIAMDSMWRDDRMDNGRWQSYVANMRKCGLPVWTDVADPDWPNLIEYPLKEVVSNIWPEVKSEADIFPDLENTINFALALAMYQKFDRICLYGCDFRAVDNPYDIARVADKLEDIKPPWFAYHDPEIVKARRDREPGEQTTMFLLGIAHARGIEVEIAQGSTLANMDRGRYVYGYQDEPKVFPVSPIVERIQKAEQEYQAKLKEAMDAAKAV